MTEALFPRNPYIGPRSFQNGERLYGRERELRTLFYLLSVERVVLFHSVSGAGKTSLIQARLIDMLKREGFHVLPIMRVGAEPYADLQTARADAQPAGNRYVQSALQALEEPLAPAQRVAPDRLGRLTLGKYLRQRPGALDDHSREVLIFDQFEEILTAEPNDRAAKDDFFAEVGEVLRDRRRWALFVIREEYLGALEPYAHFIPGNLDCRFRLDLLDVSAAHFAIRQPAAASGVDFTAEAAARLVDNLRTIHFQRQDGTAEIRLGAYIEPVQLQVVCRQLWEALAQRQSQNEHLLAQLLTQPIDCQNEHLLAQLLTQPIDCQKASALGAPTAPATPPRINVEDLSVVGDVDHALSSYYDEQIRAVVAKGVRERFLREWIERWLITGEGLRSQVLRRARETEKLPDEALALLIDAHLVREERRLGGKWCELTHDRLIEPIRQSNQEWLARHLHPLQVQAGLWLRQGEPKSMLLRDDALDGAVRWARESAAELTRDERRFLRASREAQRQAEQLRLARLREQQNARRIRRLGLTVGGLGAVSIVLVAVILQLQQLQYKQEQQHQQQLQQQQQQISLLKMKLDSKQGEIITAYALVETVRVKLDTGDRAAMLTATTARQTIMAANATVVQIRKTIDQQEQPAQTPVAPPSPSSTPLAPPTKPQGPGPVNSWPTATERDPVDLTPIGTSSTPTETPTTPTETPTTPTETPTTPTAPPSTTTPGATPNHTEASPAPGVGLTPAEPPSATTPGVGLTPAEPPSATTPGVGLTSTSGDIPPTPVEPTPLSPAPTEALLPTPADPAPLSTATQISGSLPPRRADSSICGRHEGRAIDFREGALTAAALAFSRDWLEGIYLSGAASKTHTGSSRQSSAI
ncbi:MAG: hypothetical protein HGA45_04570 [Chloroflexales bacterium]|nr:hypothetical protein [Chloroflexales bacterium]